MGIVNFASFDLAERVSEANIYLVRTFDATGELKELERYADMIKRLEAKPVNWCPHSEDEIAPSGKCSEWTCVWCSVREMMKEEEKAGVAIYYLSKLEDDIEKAIVGHTPAEAREIAATMRKGVVYKKPKPWAAMAKKQSIGRALRQAPVNLQAPEYSSLVTDLAKNKRTVEKPKAAVRRTTVKTNAAKPLSLAEIAKMRMKS